MPNSGIRPSRSLESQGNRSTPDGGSDSAGGRRRVQQRGARRPSSNRTACTVRPFISILLLEATSPQNQATMAIVIAAGGRLRRPLEARCGKGCRPRGQPMSWLPLAVHFPAAGPRAGAAFRLPVSHGQAARSAVSRSAQSNAAGGAFSNRFPLATGPSESPTPSWRRPGKTCWPRCPAWLSSTSPVGRKSWLRRASGVRYDRPPTGPKRARFEAGHAAALPPRATRHGAPKERAKRGVRPARESSRRPEPSRWAWRF